MANRAAGANVIFHLAFEGTYGTTAPSGYYSAPAYSIGVGLQQNLLDDPLLGAGRDPLAPARGAKDVAGSIEVPVDERTFGHWLRALFGPPASSVAVGARGYIEFTQQPSPDTTVVLNGVTWTFKASGATGAQSNIGANLQLTLDNLANGLNASADVEISKVTWARFGDRLAGQHDTATSAGDSYTLATTVAGAKVSGATLGGGGLYRHEFRSAAPTLPSLTLQTYHPDLDGGSYRYRIARGVMVDTLAIRQTREGAAKAILTVIGKDEDEATASVAGTPTALAVTLFSQFEGQFFVGGRRVANVSEGNLSVGNSLDPIAALGDSGTISGADPGQTAIRLSLTARFGNNALRDAARTETPIDVHYGYRNPARGTEMIIQLHEVHLPRPRAEVSGPGGIDVTYEAIGSKSVAVGRGITAVLINDQASYA